MFEAPELPLFAPFSQHEEEARQRQKSLQGVRASMRLIFLLKPFPKEASVGH